MHYTIFTDCAGEQVPAEDFQAALEAEILANASSIAADPATVASPTASQRTAAKSAPSRSTKRRSELGEDVHAQREEVAQTGGAVKEEDPADVPMEGDSFEKLKQRRLMPGASTSEADFQSLFAELAARNDTFQETAEEPVDTSDTILHKVRLWKNFVISNLPEIGSDYLQRVCVAVLALGRARQADIFLREHAVLYWIAEGGKTLRFHAGDCYMKSPSGAFQQHQGVPPDHDRVQQFLLHVEGVFRLMPIRCERTTEALLGAVAQMWAAAERDESTFLSNAVNACLTFRSDVRRGGRREGEAQEADEAPQLEGMPWIAATAKTIMAVKKQLSYELTQDKLLHYMSEWCDMPKLVEGACCYEDCAVQYDFEDVAARQVLRERLENCYLRIPHCIKGTVPQPIQERLRLFYSRTFWGNIQVFKCGQAAQALAKRGLNVVRMFIGLSSGGVGQSLYSTHLQAMYAHNFAFFDPQIWFNEEEMRKQVEQLNGCIILTGQETPASGRPCSLACRLSFSCCVFVFLAFCYTFRKHEHVLFAFGLPAKENFGKIYLRSSQAEMELQVENHMVSEPA